MRENKQLKRDGVRLFLIVEKLQSELAIIKEENDSCSAIVQEYMDAVVNAKRLYSRYEEIIRIKDSTITLEDEQIRLLKKRARLLHTKAIVTGVLAPAGAAGAAVLVTYLIMRK